MFCNERAKKGKQNLFFFYDQLLFCVSRQPTLLLCVSVVLFVTNVATRLFCVHTGVVVVSRGAESEYQMTFRSTRTNHKRAQLPTRHRTAELYTKSFTIFFFFFIFSRGGIYESRGASCSCFLARDFSWIKLITVFIFHFVSFKLSVATPQQLSSAGVSFFFFKNEQNIFYCSCSFPVHLRQEKLRLGGFRGSTQAETTSLSPLTSIDGNEDELIGGVMPLLLLAAKSKFLLFFFKYPPPLRTRVVFS